VVSPLIAGLSQAVLTNSAKPSEAITQRLDQSRTQESRQQAGKTITSKKSTEVTPPRGAILSGGSTESKKTNSIKPKLNGDGAKQ
jgi:hypothetical protein